MLPHVALAYHQKKTTKQAHMVYGCFNHNRLAEIEEVNGGTLAGIF